MLRSCYTTTARFYNHSFEEDITWYFVPDDRPWLPLRSSINSLNWVDATERVDYGLAGEVPGETRSYVKGGANLGVTGTSYCGVQADFLGAGVRPADNPPRDLFNNPLCCTGETPAVPVSLRVFVVGWDFSLFFPPVVATLNRSTSWAFNILTALMEPSASPYYPYRIDLYYSNPNSSGTNDYLDDFLLCDFPGYAPQFLYAGLILPSTFFFGEELDNDYTYTASAPTGSTPGSVAIGVVCSDAAGLVNWYITLVSGLYFVNPGDYVTIHIGYIGDADYP